MKLNAIISPALPFPPFKHGEFNNLSYGLSYCFIWNFFDFPTVVIPRVHIISEEDTNPLDYTDHVYFVDSATKSLRSSIVGSESLPCSIQVTTPTYHDEQWLGIAKKIESIINLESLNIS